jgi:hypothetical protein
MDVVQNFVHIEHQTHLEIHETLKSKEKCKSMCQDHGVIQQSFLLDNDTSFFSTGFSRHLIRFQQMIRYAGFNAHHYNGHTKRAIQMIMSITSTMMFRSAIYWPNLVDPQLWPMADGHPTPSNGRGRTQGAMVRDNSAQNHHPQIKTNMGQSWNQCSTYQDCPCHKGLLKEENPLMVTSRRSKLALLLWEGVLQEVNFDTFASIIAWRAVRAFLVASLTLLGCPTCSIHFDMHLSSLCSKTLSGETLHAFSGRTLKDRPKIRPA